MWLMDPLRRSSSLARSGTRLATNPHKLKSALLLWYVILSVIIYDLFVGWTSIWRDSQEKHWKLPRLQSSTESSSKALRAAFSLIFNFEQVIDGSSEKIIVAGKEWHKTCHAARQSESKGGRQFGEIASRNIETCPGCNAIIDGSSEKIIVAGKEWHKTCHAAKQTQTKGGRQFGEIASRNIEVCPGCSQVIDGSSEKIITAGKEWHKTCHAASQSQKQGGRQFGNEFKLPIGLSLTPNSLPLQVRLLAATSNCVLDARLKSIPAKRRWLLLARSGTTDATGTVKLDATLPNFSWMCSISNWKEKPKEKEYLW